MMKRFSLLLAALFVAATLFAAPAFAMGNDDNDNNDKVCVLVRDDDGDKDHRWINEEDKQHGDKIVKDKFCEDNDHAKKDHEGKDHAKKDYEDNHNDDR